jgi:hypothetical protein
MHSGLLCHLEDCEYLWSIYSRASVIRDDAKVCDVALTSRT